MNVTISLDETTLPKTCSATPSKRIDRLPVVRVSGLQRI
jgi:hypothetical protein